MNNFIEGNVGYSIDDDAKTAVFIVFADISDGLIENVIGQIRHGNYEIICKIAGFHYWVLNSLLFLNSQLLVMCMTSASFFSLSGKTE